jgi:hypothetical protein
MATITKTTVDVMVGQYSYRAVLDGNAVELFRDGAHAGHSTWTGQTMEPWPDVLSVDARDKLSAAIQTQLAKAWRASTTTDEVTKTTEGEPGGAGGRKPQDAGNQGQLDASGGPSRQGEAEVGEGGPGYDPRTGEVGGQSISAERRAVPNQHEVDRAAINRST